MFVKQLPPDKTQAETDQEAQDRAQKATTDGRLVYFTKWLVIATLILGAVGTLQLFVFGDQARQLRKTVEAAADQAVDMKVSIAQATRTAKAMEDVATHFERSVAQAEQSTAKFEARMAMQTRAYITVLVGDSIYQEREKNLRFQARPALMNTGNTFARKVGHRSKAAILPVPLPDNFDFPLPEERAGASVVGAHQNATISAVVDEFVEDAEVESIKNGSAGRILYVWGIVYYEDIFGMPRETKFCQALTWLPNGKTWGVFIDGFNDAT
jgi:hypothetical protein